jgi:hypothetical protein
MKTTYIVLIGVVSLGAVGAYMYMKNKKAQDDLLSGSLPTTTPSGTAPSGAQTPNLSNVSDGVSPSDANLNLANANTLMGKINNLRTIAMRKCAFNQGTCIRERNDAIRELPKVIYQLSSLGYKFDNGLLEL